MPNYMPLSKITLPNPVLFGGIAQLLKEGRTVTLPAKGSSMSPFIREGRDRVVLRKAGSLSVGDVVLAPVGEDRYVLHRIWRIEGGDVFLRGDGDWGEGERCELSAIAGKVTHILRGGQRIDCGSLAWRIRTALWLRLLPARRVLLAVGKLWNRLAARGGERRWPCE